MEKRLLIEFVQNTLIDLFVCAETFLFLTKILMLKPDKRVYRWVISVILLVASNISILAWENYILVIANVLVLFGAVFICILGNVKYKIVKCIFASFALSGFRIVVKTIISVGLLLIDKVGSIKIVLNDHTTSLFGSVLIVILITLVGEGVGKSIRYEKWISSIKNSVYIIMAIYVMMMSVVHSFLDRYVDKISVSIGRIGLFIQFISCISVYVICIGLAKIDYDRQCYEHDNLLKEQYLNASKVYFDKLRWQIDEMRRIKHDMNAQYAALDLYLKNKDCEAASSYLEMIRERQLISYSTYFTLGHELVDAVVYDTISKYEGINIVANGIIGDSKILDYDLCTIFYNLVQNAAEAIDKLKTDRKIIKIDIKHYKNELLICIKNPCDNNLSIEELGKKYTSKTDEYHHGYGISNVMRIVKKHNGDMTFDIQDSVFCVKISMEETN